MPTRKNADYKRMGKNQIIIKNTKKKKQVTIPLFTILPLFGRKALIWIKEVGPDSYRRDEVFKALSYNYKEST